MPGLFETHTAYRLLTSDGGLMLFGCLIFLTTFFFVVVTHYYTCPTCGSIRIHSVVNRKLFENYPPLRIVKKCKDCGQIFLT